ncbi:hypothetical protein ACEPAF_2765 [Sanghuangporus sanghuang]
MSTTDILFNSPALHSLKRAQLVQLCKRHNIKASGKNTELVSRLKRHARNLPSGAPLSVAVRSETEAEAGENENDANDGMMTDISDEDNVEEQLSSPVKERESQIWEIVSRSSLDSKRSVATRSQAAGEFGAAANSKPTILKSIASSIGLARSTSSNSIPAGDSSDSLAPPSSNKKDKELSSSPKPRSIFSSLMPRSRANSHESQTKANSNNNNSEENSRKSLITNAIPYNDIPMPTVSRRPQIEPFAFSYACAEDTSLVSEMSVDTLDRPVPGIGPCSSVNVNNGFGTVRLITNTNKPLQDEEEGPKLTPVVPAFDLIPPTPGKTGLHRFPAPSTPEANRSLYPIISSDDRDVDLETLTSPTKTPGRLGGRGRADKSLPALPELSPISPASPKEPFIFGSPNPRHSTAAEDFSNAASSVLAEMNARLNAGGGRTIDSNVLAAASAHRSKIDVEALMKYEFGGAGEKSKDNDAKGKKGEGSLSKKFDKLHEKAFSKMEGIDKHYAAKRVLREKEKERDKEKDEKLEPLPDNRKRKQSTLVTRKSTVLAPTKKQQQASEKELQKKRKGVVIPGAFGQDEMDVDESIVLTDVVIEEHEDEHAEQQEQQEQHDEEEENDRGPKRACVEEPIATGSTETKRVSIVPKVRKDVSNNDEGEEMDEEKKRKQSEAIKRRLEINKARRRSSRGRRVSVVPRTPIQKQKSFLASAKSFVKSVWNRGGNATAVKTNSSGPSYLRSTASSASKTLEQDAKPVPTQTQTHAPVRQSSISRASSVRASSAGAGGVARKPSASQQHSAAAPKSGLETVAEGKEEKEQAPSSSTTSAPAVHNEKVQNSQTSGPIFGSVQPRKASATLIRNPSTNGITAPATAATNSNSTATAAAGRSSRLLAPTASSLAKAIASPTKSTTTGITTTAATLRSKVPSMRGRASVMSPSKIPVFSPPGKKQQHSVTTPGGKRIFGKPLVLPTSPQARSAAEKGQDVNPITGAVSPQRQGQRVPLSFSSANANAQTQSLAGAASALALKKQDGDAKDEGARGTEQQISVERAGGSTNNQNESPRKINKALNSLRRPRISRSKVISKLGGVGSPTRAGSRPVPGSSNANNDTNAHANANAGNRLPSTPKVRSSTGIHVRRSLGGASAAAKTREGGTPGAVMLSAKKRARATEYARRKSAKGQARVQAQAQAQASSPLRAPDFGGGADEMEMEMDVDA